MDMNLVPALKLSSIERLNAAKDALMLEHQTFARNLNDVKHKLPINLRNQMGREQVYQQIIRIQYDCEQNKLTNLKKKSAQTKSLDDFHLFEQQLATLTASVERMQQEDSDSRLRYKALEKCAALHDRMLYVIENLHNSVVLADYLQNASGSTTPICEFSGSVATTSIFKQIEETNNETSIDIDVDVNAINEQKKMDTNTNVQCNGTGSTKTSNEEYEIISISDSSGDETARMPPMIKLNNRPFRMQTQVKDEWNSDHHRAKSKSPYYHHCDRDQDEWI